MIKFVTSVAFGIMISRSSIAKSRTYQFIWFKFFGYLGCTYIVDMFD